MDYQNLYTDKKSVNEIETVKLKQEIEQLKLINVQSDDKITDFSTEISSLQEELRSKTDHISRLEDTITQLNEQVKQQSSEESLLDIVVAKESVEMVKFLCQAQFRINRKLYERMLLSDPSNSELSEDEITRLANMSLPFSMPPMLPMHQMIARQSEASRSVSSTSLTCK